MFTSLKAAELLAAEGIEAEVIDLRSLRPWDKDAVVGSLQKTNRMLVAEEAWPMASYGNWLASWIQQECFDLLDAPVKVLSGLDIPYPYAKSLEKEMAPNPEKVAAAAKTLL